MPWHFFNTESGARTPLRESTGVYSYTATSLTDAAALQLDGQMAVLIPGGDVKFATGGTWKDKGTPVFQLRIGGTSFNQSLAARQAAAGSSASVAPVNAIVGASLREALVVLEAAQDIETGSDTIYVGYGGASGGLATVNAQVVAAIAAQAVAAASRDATATAFFTGVRTITKNKGELFIPAGNGGVIDTIVINSTSATTDFKVTVHGIVAS